MPVADPRASQARVHPGGDDSYRRLADTYHFLLSEHSLSALLDLVAGALMDLVPYDTLTIYEADEAQRLLTPTLVRDRYAEEIMARKPVFGQGITGWAAQQREAVLVNEAHLDPRVSHVPGTPLEPEALIAVPLLARGSVKGVMNIYRLGDAAFTEEEFALAQRFAEVAALAIDNAHIRVALEHQAQTDSLTGLYNHRFFHERLRSELVRASRSHDSVALLMLDIDDFKKLNDVHGHATGDHVLFKVAELLQATVRASDVPCRVGGEEFAVILPSCDAGDALGLARRLRDRLAAMELDEAGTITVSVGIAQGPEHAMNPRELFSCAEAAMMTAKARGKNQAFLYDDGASERPDAPERSRDVRSIAHLKMLQSLSGKLNRLNDVRQIADTIANELRTLIDYHNCRIYVAEGSSLVPIAFRGQFSVPDDSDFQLAVTSFGEGVTGRAAATAKSVLVPNALDCEFAVHLPGTDEIEETLMAIPMLYGARVNGVVTVSKLGQKQFDEDDVRLLEVLAGQASVALENARLYEAQREEAKNARSLLDFADRLSQAASFQEIGHLSVRETTDLLRADRVSLWLKNGRTGDYDCAAHAGYTGDSEGLKLIRQPVPGVDGQRLIKDRRQPLVLTPADIERQFPGRSWVEATMAVAPLQRDAGLDGFFVVRQSAPGDAAFYTEERLRLMAGISYQASVAMQKAVLYREQEEAADIASALLDFSRQLSLAEGFDAILLTTAELAARIVGSPRTGIFIQDPVSGDLLPEALWGFQGPEREAALDMRIPIEMSEPLVQATEPFVLRPHQYPDLALAHQIGAGLTYAVAPMRLEGGRLAAVAVGAPALGNYEFSERKIRLLGGIADHAKLAINNAIGFETLETTFLSTVEALANALEAKDEYTSSHTRSIVDMSKQVGDYLGFGLKKLKNLEMGALFHDIGKIGIPSDILSKPGPLSEEEKDIMRTHPELGERILAPIERLEEVRPIVRHCHEHYDGSGYPDGLVGEAIPIESRIILTCDAFDAMTTDRPYRGRLAAEEACRRLRSSAGRQFDPVIVDAFLTLYARDPSFTILFG
ncbi:MAG: diguanylate cyclase [Actinomycetota bacterium]